jgi:hypothetical protein
MLAAPLPHEIRCRKELEENLRRDREAQQAQRDSGQRQ